MDYLQKIKFIVAALEKYGYIDNAQNIASIRDAASTGSELLMSVTHELLKLVNSNSEIADLIDVDVIELKNYCWSIGLQVR